MPRRDHRKRAFLFLAAVLLPSAVLVGTTSRLIRQQRELGARRAAEERSLLALRVGQVLLEELRTLAERVPQAPLSPREILALADSEPAVVTVAGAGDGRLVFPGDLRRDPAAAPSLLARYTRLLARGEEAEYRKGNVAQAAELYGQAADVWRSGGGEDSSGAESDAASDDAQSLRAEALVRQGRALLRARRVEDARTVYRSLAETPLFILDGEGMPYGLYGLDGLHRSGGDSSEVIPLLGGTLSRPPLVSASALAAWRDIARELAGSPTDGPGKDILQGVEDVAARGIATFASLGALSADFPGLLATARQGRRSGESAGGLAWVAYGEEPWLVGISRSQEDVPSRVLIVRPGRVLGAAVGGEPGAIDRKLQTALAAVTFLPAGDRGGEALGPTLNGLRASFPPGVLSSTGDGGVEEWFFRLLLPVILLLTGFTAFLAWRDVRRETEAVRLRTQFVSSVTHELKTPLTSIRMFAETLRLGRFPSPEAGREYLDTVVHETERLSRLINNVLDFARIDRGEKTYHMASTEVGAAAREAARAVAYPLAQGEFSLKLEIAEDLPRVQADGDALTQALLNLLSNAIKFSREGSVIDLRVRREGDDVLMSVEDRGRGIAPRDREAIFQDFYRTADAERDGIPGTGLGLPLVAHVAEAHGGRVEVESERGRGSTFTLRIPVGESSPASGGAGRAEVPSASTTGSPQGGGS